MDIGLTSIRMELPNASPKYEGEKDNNVESTERTSPRTQKPTDFIALVSLALSFKLPWVHLEPSTGIQQRPDDPSTTFYAHYSYCLGTGAFSFVEMHALRESEIFQAKIYKAGDIVALKRYPVAMNAGNDYINIPSECYNFIRSELRVSSRLGPSGHDNICNLLFLGWEDHTPVPVLGFEFAHHGTVKDTLGSPEFLQVSYLGMHIVADITLGLEALHDKGIIHGDIKPGNILVFRHPKRTAIAKLADFSSSLFISDVERNGWTPVGGTAMWRAPECYGSAEYDLFKTDIYSYGLTVLTILAPIRTKPGAFDTSTPKAGDCFLAQAPVADINEFVTAMKTSKDDALLKMSSDWAESFIEEDQSLSFLLWLLQATIRVKAEDRLHLGDIVPKVMEYIKETGEERDLRSKSHPMDIIIKALVGYRKQLPASNDVDLPGEDERVLSLEQMRDDRLHSCLFKFQVRVFTALKKVAQPALDVEFQTIDLDNSTPASRERVAELMEANMKVANYKSYTSEDVQRAILASFRIGENYIVTGFGTRRDLAKGLPYLSASARNGRLLSLLHFTLIDSSVGDPNANGAAPRQLWLILNASAGSPMARSLITKHHPELVDWMNFLIRAPGGVCGRLRRSFWTRFEDPEEEVRYLRETPADELDPIYHYQKLGRNPLYYAVGFGCKSQTVKDILADGFESEDLEAALLIAAQGGQGQLVSLLLDNGAKGTARDPKNGATALHYLALIGDDIVGDLASRLVTSASQLSVQASPQQPVSSETLSVLQRTPILWACMMNNTTLFASLLGLHKSFKAPIVDSKMLIEFAVEHHLDSILSMAFEDGSPLKDSITSNMEDLDRLLTIALRGQRVVHCNFHMQGFPEVEQKTIDLLLDAGADPCRYSGESDPFDIVIRGDFLNPFKRLVAAVEKKGVDPKTILQDTRRFDGKTALETTICAAGWNIFCFILDNNLGSLDDTFRSGDQNALHISATIGDVRFIDRILKANVSPLLFTRTGYRPFDLAIIAQNLDFARTLYNSYKDRERFLAEDDRGFSTFSRLVYASRTVYRNVIDMDAIRLVIELGGFTEYYSTVSGESIIRELSKAPYSFTRPDNAAFDVSLLKEVVDRTSAELINETDSDGLAPLHYMVLNANYEGVKAMINNEKVNINVAAGSQATQPKSFSILETRPWISARKSDTLLTQRTFDKVEVERSLNTE